MAGNAAEQAGGSLKRRSPGVQARASGVKTFEGVHEMNGTTIVDMRQFVEARDGLAFTTSQQVASAFGKQHHHVMQKLESLECSDQFLTSNFSRVQFEHRGNTYEAIEMTKDGFVFLVMGFTGKKAAAIKEGYIAAFNALAKSLSLSSTELVGDLIGSVIGTSGEHVLDRVIDQKASPVSKGLQRSFRHTMKSRLRSRFNVQRTALIPAECLADACNFVAAYALEGEFLGKETPCEAKALNIHYPVESLTARRPEMMTIRNSEQAWLDVTLHDLRDIRGEGTPLEQLIWQLEKAGFDISGAWWELRTYRNKIREFQSFAIGVSRMIEDPHRYAITPRTAA